MVSQLPANVAQTPDPAVPNPDRKKRKKKLKFLHQIWLSVPTCIRYRAAVFLNFLDLGLFCGAREEEEERGGGEMFCKTIQLIGKRMIILATSMWDVQEFKVSFAFVTKFRSRWPTMTCSAVRWISCSHSMWQIPVFYTSPNCFISNIKNKTWVQHWTAFITSSSVI